MPRGALRPFQPGHVVLQDPQGAAVFLRLVPGTYRASEAQRLPPKLVQGSPRYTDFLPEEAAAAQDTWNRGYGLRRYSDWPRPDEAYGFILEADGVDCGYPVACLGPEVASEPLPNATAPVQWVGWVQAGSERAFLACAGPGLYTRAANGTWTLRATRPAAPVAVTTFAGRVLLGYGAARAAEWTSDFTTFTPLQTDDVPPVALYAYALVSDRATVYLAGGPATTDQATVWASADGGTFARASRVVCGDPAIPITALAPGGPAGLLLVGKETECGLLDALGLYRSLVPFDTRQARNGVPLRWTLGQPGEEQRGPLVVFLHRDGQPWLLVPQAGGGEAQTLAPWAHPALRPPTIRGAPQAVVGTGRWLYWTLYTAGGQGWLLRHDLRTQVSLPLARLGTSPPVALALWTESGPPYLFATAGTGAIARIALPQGSEFPPDDPTYRYTPRGTLQLPAHDLLLPAEQKVLLAVDVVADNLQAGTRWLTVYWHDEYGTRRLLGTVAQSPRGTVEFPAELQGAARPRVFQARLELEFQTTDATQTPLLRAVIVRQALIPRVLRVWEFQSYVPGGSGALGTADTQEPQAVLAQLWTWRQSGAPVLYTDVRGVQHLARLVRLEEQATAGDAVQEAQALASVALLEIEARIEQAWETQTLTPSWTSTFFPFRLAPNAGAFPTTLMPARWTTSTTVRTTLALTYPQWTFTGPGTTWTCTNTTANTSWSLLLGQAWPAGRQIQVDFAPTRQTVLDDTGQPLAAPQTGTMWTIGQAETGITVTVQGVSPQTQVQIRWGVA